MRLHAYAAERHGAQAVMLRSLFPLISAAAKTTWIHAAKPGRWEGHPAGPFEFTRETFEQIVARFNEQVNPIPLTFEHPDYVGNGQPIPAAGWIHNLEVREDGLWAFVEFTEPAAALVKQGSYRFCSVVVAFSTTDPETAEDRGPELIEVGLVGLPFIDGLTPIRLSKPAAAESRSLAKDSKETTRMMSIKDILKAALKELPDEATVEQFLAYIDAESRKQEAIHGKPSSGPPAEEAPASAPPAADAVKASAMPIAAPVTPAPMAPPPVAVTTPAAPALTDAPATPPAETAAPTDPVVKADDAPPAEVQLQMDDRQMLAEQLALKLEELSGMDLAAALAIMDERAADFAALFGGAAPGGTEAEAQAAGLLAQNRKLQGEITALRKEVGDIRAAEQKRRDEDSESMVAAAIEAGHVLEDQRAQLVSLGKRDQSGLRLALSLASGKPAVPTDRKVTPRPPAEGDSGADLPEQEIENVMRTLGVSSKYKHDKTACRAEAISLLRDMRRREAARA